MRGETPGERELAASLADELVRLHHRREEGSISDADYRGRVGEIHEFVGRRCPLAWRGPTSAPKRLLTRWASAVAVVASLSGANGWRIACCWFIVFAVLVIRSPKIYGSPWTRRGYRDRKGSIDLIGAGGVLLVCLISLARSFA